MTEPSVGVPSEAGCRAPGGAARRGPRAWMTGCLSLAAVPLLLALALVVWASLGPAPAPGGCLPPDAAVRLTVRRPAELVAAALGQARVRAFLEEVAAAQGEGKFKVPDAREVSRGAARLRMALGSEAAVAADPSGQPVFACRPGLVIRALEKLNRVFRRADADGVRVSGDLHYGFVGRTLVASPDRKAAAAALARLGGAPAAGGSLPAEVRAALDFRVVMGASGEQPQAEAVAALLLGLPERGTCAGRVAAPEDFGRLVGHALVSPAEADAGRPPRAAGGFATAALVPGDALLYRAWLAPADAAAGRWSAAGRADLFMRLAAALAPEFNRDLGVIQARSGLDLASAVPEALAGERAVYVVGQSAPGGARLCAAATALFEAREPAAAWTLVKRALQAGFGPLSADGKPTLKDQRTGEPLYPFLAPRSHRGVEVIEMVYDFYPLGAGCRPAFAMAGKFLAAGTSRAEVERLLDRAAAAARPGPDGRPLTGLLVLRPQGRGQEIADLCLALARWAADPRPGPGPEEERVVGAFGGLLSALDELRLEWSPAAGEEGTPPGSMRLELQARLAPAK